VSLGPTAPAAPADATFDGMLASYRDLVAPAILGAIPDREPKKYLYALVAEHVARSGKGIRPALCIATCRAFGGRAEDAVPSAAAIELLHNAFLVHDDIEDSSEYRRGHPTLHRLYGVPLALNAGDAMNAMAVRALKANLTRLGPGLALHIFDEFDHMSLETIEGQAMELGWIRDNDCTTTEEDYLLMVLKKTCWYSFIHPCRIGALIAGRSSSELDRLNRFGHAIGTAFQIQDDVLNLTGARDRYGKEIGGDILEGKRTLMLAHLLRTCPATDRARISAFLGKPRAQRVPREVRWVVDRMKEQGSIEHARGVAKGFVAQALAEFEASFGALPAGPDVSFLRALVHAVVDRGA
jgi:geranylgeranyl diphosphate synthase type II